MFKKIVLALTVSISSVCAFAANSIVEMKTSMGNVEIELFDEKAPITVRNFQNYINDKFYDGLIFHRVIPEFMVQTGGFTVDMTEKNNKAPIRNESYNGLSNKRGTLAMARTNNPNSAASQFFINVADNNFLDKSEMNAGYAVFGQVTKGMDVVDKISKAPTTSKVGRDDVPKDTIKIISIRLKN
jgi:peptidyl-prolyl cis-trans isomerase A (cyclophilin A)